MRIATAAALAAFFLSGPALALSCGPKAAVEARLAEGHGERLAFEGVQADGNRLLVLTNPASGSWTALLRPRAAPDLLCFLAEGSAGRIHLDIFPES
ncbi:MAG: hypothetical protein Kilf2KO_49160 [Rhodospirillales bacterium]